MRMTRNHVCPQGQRGFESLPLRQFEILVCDHMVSLHHAHKRTDIRRNDKNQRGYAHVVLRDGNYVESYPEPDQPELVPF